ncbi:MAG: hypothetical protein ACI9BF_000549 [Candidatus Paceibacteria bacterium]|jgi:hypothetical protein
MHPEKEDHLLLRELTLENQRLLIENNQLLKKMNHREVLSFWFRIVWFLVLIGAPFLLYFYVIEPYFISMGSSFEIFKQGLREVPGWKQFYEAVAGSDVSGE